MMAHLEKDVFGVFLMLTCGYLFAAVAGIAADALAAEDGIRRPLPDLLFQALPEIEDAGEAVNDKAELAFLCVAAPVLLWRRKLRLAARQIYVIQSALWVLRAPAFSVPRLPNPYPKCRPVEGLSLASPGKILELALGVLRGTVHTCADVMFSGHTAGLTMILLVVLRHAPSAWPYFWSHFLGTVLVMVCSRFHYTTDVYVGFVVASFFCWWYFERVDRAMREARATPRRLGTLSSFLVWYEGDLHEGPGVHAKG